MSLRHLCTKCESHYSETYTKQILCLEAILKLKPVIVRSITEIQDEPKSIII